MKQIIVDNISTTYYITEDGKCYNEKTGRYLKGQVNYRNGYLSYNLKMPNGAQKRFYAHRLVANAFIGNPENKEEVNHLDGNKLNNSKDNLEWATSSENKQHALDLELRKTKHVFCFSQDKALVAEYKSAKEASAAVNISIPQIVMELNKEIKTLTGGFYWSYSRELGETKKYTASGRAKPVNQYDRNGKYIMTYPSCGAAARATNSNFSHIAECCRGKIKSHNNFVWRYVEDIVSPSDESRSAPQEQ